MFEDLLDTDTKIVHDIAVLIVMTSKHFWLLQCI